MVFRILIVKLPINVVTQLPSQSQYPGSIFTIGLSCPASFFMIVSNFKNIVLIAEASSPKIQAAFLFLLNKIQAIIKKGFANHDKPAASANITSQPSRKASNDVLQVLWVQKRKLKSDSTKRPPATIRTADLSFDFSSTGICSSSENGMGEKFLSTLH